MQGPSGGSSSQQKFGLSNNALETLPQVGVEGASPYIEGESLVLQKGLNADMCLLRRARDNNTILS